jgi:endonuclease G
MRAISPALSLLVLAWTLPAAAADDDCKDMLSFTGAPEYKGSEAPDHTILCRAGYVLSYNTNRLTPDWVLEVLNSNRFKGTADRTALRNPFAPDPDLKPGERSELKDYAASGYDRGHMAPAADMKFSREAMIQSFYLSNMAPQVGIGMNRGIWADLEKLTRQWVCGHSQLIAISGPIYADTPKTVGDDKVAVPTAFYKILYAPQRKRIIAFVLPNKSVDKGGKTAVDALKQFLVKAGDIEDRVGLSFLDALAPRDRTRLLDMAPAMWSKLDLC